MRGALLGGIAVVALGTGCMRRVYDPPARLTVGATTRHHPATPVEPKFRASTSSGSPQETLDASEAKLLGIGFTMASRYGTYAGGEVETGVLGGAAGSSAAAVYGVFGIRKAFPGVNFAAEIVGGQRWLRYGGMDGEVSALVAEPRIKADFWLGERFSLGAVTGMTLGDQQAWMAGVFLGIHSHDFGRFGD